MDEGSTIGSFVEVNRSTVGKGSRALHLAFLGDTDLGEDVNVGAGSVTANYNGRDKHRTRVGDRASLGAGTLLVAPVRVGDDAVTGAGTVVPAGRDVPPGETVVGVPARPLRQGAEAEPGRKSRSRKGRPGASDRKR